MEIYVVTSGVYSDYNIDAVFLDKKKAEYFAKFHTYGEGRIEVFESMDNDYEIDTQVINYYEIDMAGDGTIRSIDNKQYEHIPGDNKFVEKFKHTSKGFSGLIIAESDEQAIKIMLDKRACWLAKQYGVTV